MVRLLKEPGPNPAWNVPRSLEMLQGLERSGILLIEEFDKHISQRDSGQGKHPEMMGTAAAAIMVTAFSVEIALKSLHALEKLNEKPPSGHDLLKLFDALDSDNKMESQNALEQNAPIGHPSWVGPNPDIRTLIAQGRSNFTQWRYLPEKGRIGSGVPKVMINVAHALRAVLLEKI